MKPTKTNIKTTRDVIVQTLKYVSGDTLDVGAGSAKYRTLIEANTKKYIAYDMFPGPNIDVVGDALNIFFPNSSFDTVISTQVIEHIEKPWVMVKEIGRILRPGGICILSAPFIIPYHADPNDFFRYTKNGLISLFKNEGFDVIDCESYGKTFSVFSEFIHFLFANPYEKKQSCLSRRLLAVIEKVCAVCDKVVRNEIIYPNSYIVARKK